ncbi:hypothetical protein [Streptomyces macrosporus]|uniref:Uncharacterized protein n=1 Tax=Streptomyces macrosporus TaxID=44032 RepID=A0ABN3K924_9ACTN
MAQRTAASPCRRRGARPGLRAVSRPGPRSGRRRAGAHPAGGAVGVLLAVVALLLGVLAPSVAAADGTPWVGGARGTPSAGDPVPPDTSLASLPHVVTAPCAAGCERPPLLYRDATGERHAAHPGGATLPGRAHLPRPAEGIRPSAAPPDVSGSLHTARHPGRAPPPPSGS